MEPRRIRLSLSFKSGDRGMDGVPLCLSDEEAVLHGLFGPDCVVRASIRMEVGDL